METMNDYNAQPGDIVNCRGISSKIDKIISQYHDFDYDEKGNIKKTYYGIEFFDDEGVYRYWKQRFDGGNLVKANRKD